MSLNTGFKKAVTTATGASEIPQDEEYLKIQQAKTALNGIHEGSDIDEGDRGVDEPQGKIIQLRRDRDAAELRCRTVRKQLDQWR